MSATEFEQMHGAVLARLLAQAVAGGPCASDLRPAEGWSSLAVPGGAAWIVRHRPRPRRLRARPGGRSWRFAFSADQLDRLRRLTRGHDLHLLLACGRPGRGDSLEVALLAPGEVARVLDLGSFLEQRLTVQARPRKELWVSRHRMTVKVPRRRFDRLGEWLSAGPREPGAPSPP
jgi:hypothetical protein